MSWEVREWRCDTTGSAIVEDRFFASEKDAMSFLIEKKRKALLLTERHCWSVDDHGSGSSTNGRS